MDSDSSIYCPPFNEQLDSSGGRTGVILCVGINSENTYNTEYNQAYYYNETQKDNCCNGQFGWINKNGILSKIRTSSHSIFYTKNNRGIYFGDISYPRNQRGRWNTSTTNTKLYPIISMGRTNPICQPNLDSNGKCIGYRGTQNAQLIVQKQSGRLFSNTNPNMSKQQTFSYLMKNRRYLNR